MLTLPHCSHTQNYMALHCGISPGTQTVYPNRPIIWTGTDKKSHWIAFDGDIFFHEKPFEIVVWMMSTILAQKDSAVGDREIMAIA